VAWNGSDAVLLDFGHAQRLGQVSPIPGTAGFEAPELEKGLPNTCSTDAFSVGKVLQIELRKFVVKDDVKLQFVAHCLCIPDKQQRMSLRDAYGKLKEQQEARDHPMTKKAKIIPRKAAVHDPKIKILSLFR